MRLAARPVADHHALAAALRVRLGAPRAADVGQGDGLVVQPVLDHRDVVDPRRAHRLGLGGGGGDGAFAGQQRRPVQRNARQHLGAQLWVERVEVAVKQVCRLVEDQVIDLPVSGDVEPPGLAQQVDHIGEGRHPVEDRQRVRLQRRAALGGAPPVEHGALGPDPRQRLLALPDAVLGALRDRQLGQDQHPRRHHLGGTARRRGGVGGVGGDRRALRQLGRAGAAQPAADPARLSAPAAGRSSARPRPARRAAPPSPAAAAPAAAPRRATRRSAGSPRSARRAAAPRLAGRRRAARAGRRSARSRAAVRAAPGSFRLVAGARRGRPLAGWNQLSCRLRSRLRGRKTAPGTPIKRLAAAA